MSPGSDTRERMIASTATLIRERGAAATSLDDILRHSDAPRGSIYHHFPGGRAQLLEEAVTAASGGVAPLGTAGIDPLTAFDAFLAAWRARLEESDFRAGCPVLAVAIESDADNPQLTQAAAATFATWTAALEAVLTGHGATPARARRLATLVIAAVEGAVVLSRANRDTRPLDDVGKELRGLLKETVDA